MPVMRWQRVAYGGLLAAAVWLGTTALLAASAAPTRDGHGSSRSGKSMEVWSGLDSAEYNRQAAEMGQATPDGYRQENLFLAIQLLTAYVPQTGGGAYYTSDQVIGAPAWLYGDSGHYIDAKVDPADLADWRNPTKQPAMLRSMLQAMLVEMLKLVVHRSTETVRFMR